MIMGLSVNRLESSVFFGTEEPEVIETRFGKITLRKDKAIAFPRGLSGMPDKFSFFITEFPSDKLRRFKMLQSLDDYGLSFITLPLDLQNGIIAAEDLSQACKELNIKVESLAILLIVSVHRSPQKVSLSVNARAPILIDSSMRLAAQHVFQSEKYKVQHYITA
jgi:flagellar assembly factor FliW